MASGPALIARISVSAQTLVLRGQSRSAASFLKCTQTPQAETCPATSCWTRTTTRRAPPCEEAAAPPRRCPPGGRGGRTPVSADQTPSGPRWPEGRPGHGSRRLSRPHETETAEAGARGRMTRVVEKLAFSTWGSSHTKKRNRKKTAPAERGQASAPCAQVAPRAAGPSRGLLPDKPHSPGKPPAACCLEPRPCAQGGAPAPSQVTAGSVTSANWMCLVGLPDVDRNVLFFVCFFFF